MQSSHVGENEVLYICRVDSILADLEALVLLHSSELAALDASIAVNYRDMQRVVARIAADVHHLVRRERQLLAADCGIIRRGQHDGVHDRPVGIAGVHVSKLVIILDHEQRHGVVAPDLRRLQPLRTDGLGHAVGQARSVEVIVLVIDEHAANVCRIAQTYGVLGAHVQRERGGYHNEHHG